MKAGTWLIGRLLVHCRLTIRQLTEGWQKSFPDKSAVELWEVAGKLEAYKVTERGQMGSVVFLELTNEFLAWCATGGVAIFLAARHDIDNDGARETVASGIGKDGAA